MNIDWMCLLKAVVGVVSHMALSLLLGAIILAAVWCVVEALDHLGIGKKISLKGIAIAGFSLAFIGLIVIKYLENCP